jgi:hypothetical protein
VGTPRLRLLAALTALTAVLGLLGACSDDDAGDADGGASGTTEPAAAAGAAGSTDVPDGAVGAPDLATAVEALLTAEAAGDHAASYARLSAASRAEFPSASAWERRREQLPVITGFEIESPGVEATIAVVDHEAGLDPFVGLGARERQTWTGIETASGWLVDAEPEREYLLPPDEGAATAAQQWAEAVQACDRTAAQELQAVPELFGDLAPADGLCGSEGEVVTGDVGMLASGPASGDIVAQYTTDALVWSRLVRVDAPVALGVVMAPIGDDWRVLGVTP